MSSATPPNIPEANGRKILTSAQQEAINAATDEMGWMESRAYQDEIKHVISILQEDELLERLCNVEHDSSDGWILAITDRRFMLVRPKFFRGMTVMEYPFAHITLVEWNPGRFRHRITAHIDPQATHIDPRLLHRKVEFYCLWRNGLFKARKTAELLRSKIPGQEASVAKDSKERKANEVEDFLSEKKANLGLPVSASEVKHLQEVLRADERPTHLADAKYLEWNGLNISKSIAKDGLLAATDQRLLFLCKEPLSKLTVEEFAYESIQDVTFTHGFLNGSITIHTDRGNETFDKIFDHEVDAWVQYLKERMNKD